MAERAPIHRENIDLRVVSPHKMAEITVLPVEPVRTQAVLPGILLESTMYSEGGMGRMVEHALTHGETIVTRAELNSGKAQDIPHQLRDELIKEGVHEARIINTGLTKLVSRDLGGNIVKETNWT